MGILQQVVSRTLLVAGRALANCSLVVLWIAFYSAGTEARAESPNPVAMQDYTVVMTWTEQSPVSPDVQVGGCLYRDPVTGRHVERYFDAGGAPLDRAALKGLGILAKQWNPVKRSQPTEFAPSEKRVEKIQLKPLLSFEETPQLVFPPKDIAALLEEDSLDSGEIKGLLRIGIAEDMIPAIEVRPNEATAGAWQVKEDGVRVWALTLRSLDAVGQRVRISGLRPQPGLELIVYPSDSLGEARAITKEGWSPTCFGEALTLECRIAPQVTDFLPFTLDGLVYLYRDPLTASAEKAEACNIPVVCEVGWATAAMSVGGLGTVSRGAALFCTGTLIADMVPETTIPYFLTANHCVGDVEGAENLEVYWLYQASTCDGTADSLEDVPRTTGGADILTTSNYLTGTDVSLLQLRGSVPEGIPYAGWTTDTVAPERGVVAIHHPSGAPKCISFGVVPDRVDGERLVPESRFHAVVWNRGTTERGSSGCPLFVEDSGLIVGQLYGGYASCDSPAEPDYFGRFDKSYALLRPYLDPGDDHGDDAGSSTIIQADGTPVSGAIEESGDVDWFNFPAGVGTCTLQTEGEADTVLTLYGTDGVTVLACNDDSDGPQSLITWEMSAVGTYYASVQLRNGSNTGTYSLAVTAQDVVPKTGSLTVTILPEDAVTAGAKWKADESSWQDTGATLRGLTPGTHMISFKDIEDWDSPPNITTYIIAEQATSATVTYTRTPPPPPVLSVGPAPIGFTSNGGTQTFQVNTTAYWSLSVDQFWVSVNPAFGIGAATVTVSCAENTGETRSAVITVSGENTNPGVVAIGVEQTAAKNPQCGCYMRKDAKAGDIPRKLLGDRLLAGVALIALTTFSRRGKPS